MGMQHLKIATLAVALLIAGCSGESATQAETTALPAPLAEPVTAWKTNRSVDRINDAHHYTLSSSGREGRLTISIGCHSTVPWKDIALYSEDLWPGDETYYVSSRLDSKRGKSLEPWHGARKFASPDGQAAQDALIEELLSHARYVVRVGSTSMERSLEDEFDLHELPEAFAVFDAECRALQG
jgi:hypothetical protein